MVDASDNLGFVSLKDVRVRKQSVKSGRVGTEDAGECGLDGVRVAALTKEDADLVARQRIEGCLATVATVLAA
jgi:hypothetical protein